MFSMRRCGAFPLLLALTALLTGCLGGGSNVYSVTGTVIEVDTGNPLWGASVAVGSRQTATNARGEFELKRVPAGSHTLSVTLDGYKPENCALNVSRDTAVSVELESPLPPFWNGSVCFEWYDTVDYSWAPAYDGATLGSLMVSYWAWTDEVLDMGRSRGEITRVIAVVNGEPFEGVVDAEDITMLGNIPLAVGSNTVQIRIWDDKGSARTSKPFTFTADVDNFDLRVLLTWDTLDDLDLCIFFRDPGEPNTFDPSIRDVHHISWSNPYPDFGLEAGKNPFYELGSSARGPESIIFPQLIPGDYHIWIEPVNASGIKAKTRIFLNAETSKPSEIVETELAAEGPTYVITVRVAENGTVTVEPVPPVPQDVVEE